MKHSIASAMIGSLGKHKRKDADFYPSPFEVTQALMNHLKLPAGTFVWEPACGDGDMSLVLEANGLDVVSSDLRTEIDYGEGGFDFLDPDLQQNINPEWIITNPPFNLSVDFIRRALQIAPNVAMLLKSQYWHAKNRIPLFREFPPAEVLALTWRPAFLKAERGNAPLMDVVWVVWREGDISRTYDVLEKPSDLPEIERPMPWDLKALLA